MLFRVTSFVDFVGTAVSLWLALYLLGRAVSSRVTLRAVGILIFLSAFFLACYINLYHEILGAASIRAILLIAYLSIWNDLTHKVIPVQAQSAHSWRVGAIYILGALTTLLLLAARTAFINEQGNALWMAEMETQPPSGTYIVFQVCASASILYSFRLGARAGTWAQNRYFLAASLLTICAVAYRVLGLLLSPSLPRWIEDGLLLISIVLLGVSVARYQTLVEWRATWEDLPISAFAVLCLAAVYLLVARQMGLTPVGLIFATLLAVFTHSIYNLVREFLDRLRSREQSAFRQRLRGLATNSNNGIPLQARLHDALQLLCQTLGASGAFVATEHGGKYSVVASNHSLPIGNAVPVPDGFRQDACQPPPELSSRVIWLIPALLEDDLVAVLGVGPLKSRLQYTEDDLSLMSETADHMGNLVYLYAHRPASSEGPHPAAADIQAHRAQFQAKSEELLASLVANPDPRFVLLVEQGLRNLTDCISLGRSSLPERLGARGQTHIEKGKAVQQRLLQAIDALRPAQDWSKDPVPRECYSYIVLHDAYWEGIPNREIMAKLHISEGTFHRTRRAAVRAVARSLLEKQELAA